VLSPTSLPGVLPTYLRLRDVQRALNTVLLRTVSKKGVEESARALDFWARGKIVLEDEDDGGVLMDFALYEYRTGSKNAVERYLARGAVQSADERTVLEAMLRGRFTLVEVEDVVPTVGVHAVDRIYGNRSCWPTWGCRRRLVPGS
jgi:hypothetical protein